MLLCPDFAKYAAVDVFLDVTLEQSEKIEDCNIFILLYYDQNVPNTQ